MFVSRLACPGRSRIAQSLRLFSSRWTEHSTGITASAGGKCLVDQETGAVCLSTPALLTLDKSKPIPDRLILGYSNSDELSPTTFEENEAGVAFLHDVLRRFLLEDSFLQGQATMQRNGYLNICDQRNPPPFGRIPEIEDQIAMVQLENGQILPDSYEPMPTFRPLTITGILQTPSDAFLAKLSTEYERLLQTRERY